MFSAPFVIQFAIEAFDQASFQQFSLWKTFLGLVCFTLIPLVLGLWLRKVYGPFSPRWTLFFRQYSVGIALGLNLSVITTALGVTHFLKIAFWDQLTIAIGVGIQNSPMAMMIALTLLQRPVFAVIAVVYGLTMFFGEGILMFLSHSYLDKNSTHQ